MEDTHDNQTCGWMIGQEILESENRDEYIYALTIRAEQVITYTFVSDGISLLIYNILEDIRRVCAIRHTADIAKTFCLVVWRERLRAIGRSAICLLHITYRCS